MYHVVMFVQSDGQGSECLSQVRRQGERSTFAAQVCRPAFTLQIHWIFELVFLECLEQCVLLAKHFQYILVYLIFGTANTFSHS